jgi:hypothetical protein
VHGHAEQNDCRKHIYTEHGCQTISILYSGGHGFESRLETGYVVGFFALRTDRFVYSTLAYTMIASFYIISRLSFTHTVIRMYITHAVEEVSLNKQLLIQRLRTMKRF